MCHHELWPTSVSHLFSFLPCWRNILPESYYPCLQTCSSKLCIQVAFLMFCVLAFFLLTFFWLGSCRITWLYFSTGILFFLSKNIYIYIHTYTWEQQNTLHAKYIMFDSYIHASIRFVHYILCQSSRWYFLLHNSHNQSEWDRQNSSHAKFKDYFSLNPEMRQWFLI